MPAEGKKSTAADLRAAFPEAAWLAGPQLHQTHRQIAHRWLYLDDPSSWQKTLLVRLAPTVYECQLSKGRTLYQCMKTCFQGYI